MTNSSPIFFALIGGILPAVLWLLFWLEEDSKRPEPKGMIIGTFVLGMVGTVGVLPLEKLTAIMLPSLGTSTFIVWAAIEEAAKFLAALVALRSIEDNEPLDPLMYMIVAALGFVALENALFIANPLLQQDIAGGVITGNLRFIGASLLHIVSSGAIGASLALSFYKSRATQVWYLFLGCVAAICIHTAFNLFILHEDSLGTLLTFATVWAGVAALFLIFEKVKSIPLSTSESRKDGSRGIIG